MKRFKLGWALLAACVWVALVVLPGSSVQAQDEAGVNVILKNDSGAGVEAELIDQYGGNFTATVEAGMSQNQNLLAGSEIKVGGVAVHTVTSADEGQEIVIAGP